MLRPEQNRLDYGDLLAPPEGYNLNVAVGTTYSLNLETLLGIPFALTLEGAAGDEDQKQDIVLLDIIRKNASKLHIFCETGRISVPRENRKVLSLLEDSISQVKPPKGKSFHPKAWVVKYSPYNGDFSPIYRVLTLSRNLTFERNWDLSVMLEGSLVKEQVPANEPLANFILYLNRFQQKDKRKRIVKQLAEEIKYVRFEAQLPGKKYFHGYEFFPMGIKEEKQPESLQNESFHELVIISPFLSKSTVKGFKDNRLSKSEMVLISRPESLQSLNKEILEGVDCWRLKDILVEGETMIEEEGVERSAQDLHAKLYLKCKNSRSELWIGSANCTQSAFNGNVEFMLKLYCYWYQYNKQILLQELMGEEDGSENPFERWQPEEEKLPPPESESQKEMENLAEQVARSKASAQVHSLEKVERYQLEIFFKNKFEVPQNMEVQISPLMKPELAKPIDKELVFDDLHLSEVSMFYQVSVRHKCDNEIEPIDFVLKIPTKGIPEERDASIFKNAIKNRQGFFQYVALILGEDIAVSLAELFNSESNKNWIINNEYEYRPVIFEKMLKAAAQNPERFNELNEIMEIILKTSKEGENIVPPDFLELHQVFEKLVRGKK